MTTPLPRLMPLVLLLALCPLCALGQQQEIAAGPWSATVGSLGPEAICYKGEPVVQKGGLGGYLPAWKGERFGMGGAEITADDASATWRKSIPDNQDATLEVRLSPEKCVFALDTTIRAAGPSEHSIQIVPEAVRAAETHCFVWVDGQVQAWPLEGEFDKLGGIRELRFEQPERTVIIRCEGYELQDRRAAGAGLFLVQVIGSSGKQPRSVQRTIEIEVREAGPEDIGAREALVSQRPLTHTPVAVRNPGFEAQEGFETWNPGSPAVIDTEIKHGGEQAARLVITGDVAGGSDVYITCNVPVIEGRIYQAEAWIKAQDVVRATPNGMSSTGATIIIEFGDKQGKWLAGGSYAKGVYGTGDWRRIVTGLARAPKGVGSAIIFLALRAHGTAWFDDIKLREVRHHAVMLEPLPGRQVADNTPDFNWYVNPMMPVSLELCRDEGFAEGEVIRVPTLGDPPVSVRQPIAPGVWHWRVAATDSEYASGPWRFVQTASLDQDCTDPEIAETHGFLRTRDAPATVRYSDAFGVTKARLLVDGEDVTEAADIRPTRATYAPKDGWTEGLHRVDAQVWDAAGNSARRKLFFTHCAPIPKTEWKQIGGVETDGEKRFLFGMYGIMAEHLPIMAAGGFDFVHNYTWDGSGTNETAIEYLDAAREHGLQAFIGITRKRLMTGDQEFVAERVAALMKHPGLLAWYLFDEPGLPHQYVSPEWLERYYRLIKALDPFHPVIVTCAYDTAVPEYRDALDVHWTQVYGSTARVAGRLDMHRAELHEGTPLAAILHCYDRAQYSLVREGGKGDPAKFQPDGRLMRANAFMAVAHNSSCLIWWWWGQGGSFTVAHVPEAWASLQETVADIKSLAPVLTGEGEISTWVETPAEGIEVHVWEKKLADRTVIIAVNRDDAECEVRCRPKTLPQDCTLTVLFEGRELEVKGGVLSDGFEGLGVHVYEWVGGE